MADFDEWGDSEAQGYGSGRAGGQDNGAPTINGGLLDPRTFPVRSGEPATGVWL